MTTSSESPLLQVQDLRVQFTSPDGSTSNAVRGVSFALGREKLGIIQKYIPSGEPCDGTQEMGALAALDCLKDAGVDPLEIDAIVCFGEEWKEYPLTTSAIYI